MASLVFKVPGKTFLAGEYLALHEGPTLVFASQPCFQMLATPGHGELQGIHPESPAGLFVRDNPAVFSKFNLTFSDGYEGVGGFGASTAQFLSVYAMSLVREESHQDMEKLFDLKHLLETYYRYAWNGQGKRPSGADLVGQLKGALTFFEKRRSALSTTDWPFANLEFHLVHTGNKVATHEHLRNLTDFAAHSLEGAFALIRQAFEKQSEEDFVAGIHGYAVALKELGFTCEPTLQLLEEVRAVPGVLAAKGCGALGADVILVVTRKSQAAEFRGLCAVKGLKITASNRDIATGLQFALKD